MDKKKSFNQPANQSMGSQATPKSSAAPPNAKAGEAMKAKPLAATPVKNIKTGK